MGVVRLYVDQPLGNGQSVPLSREQAHYLFGVMRLGLGDEVRIFNGVAGEFAAGVAEAGKRSGTLVCTAKTAELQMPPDLWLLFAPIKKARTDFIVEKAAELGAARICPVLTDYTNAERVRRERLQAHAVEAAEQCGGTFVPEVTEAQRLTKLLEDWPADRQLIFCDEAEAGRSSALTAFFARDEGRKDRKAVPAAILIGPEGGFSAEERDRLKAHPQAVTISLGPRVLRADTAAVAALTLWQAARGDWR